jgi:carbonic anhydrase/acetyltransferase-like protein (isoleucine patch superfamily)
MSSLTRQLGKMIRETGQALNVLGMTAQDQIHHLDHFSRHRKTMALAGRKPILNDAAWVASTASVIGDVCLGKGVSVWYRAVVRADEGMVEVGEGSNVQDDVVLGGTKGVKIGKGVTIGHGAVIQSSEVEDGCLIGIKAVLSGSKVRQGSMVAAGAILGPGSEVGSGQLWAGNPAVHKRDLSAEEIVFLSKSSQEYSELAQIHAKQESSAPSA